VTRTTVTRSPLCSYAEDIELPRPLLRPRWRARLGRRPVGDGVLATAAARPSLSLLDSFLPLPFSLTLPEQGPWAEEVGGRWPPVE
jgi:hypothetical protein